MKLAERRFRHLRISTSFVIRHSLFVIPSVHPLAAVGNEDWQFFHHELGFANGANHVYASRGVPFLRHLFSGMAAPTFDVSMTGENMAIDLGQVAFVQPRLASAIYVIAVIEHEARPVGVAEIFKADDLHLVSRLAVV